MGIWSLAGLNNYTRDLPDERKQITVNNVSDVALFEALRGSFNNSRFLPGNRIEQRIKSNIPLGAKAHGENIGIPVGGSPDYNPLYIPLAEVIDVATITKQAMDRATGMPGSWGSAVDEAISDMQNVSFKEFLRFNTIGTGTGRLAKVHSAAVASDGSANTWVKVYCDNVYETFGWDNTQMIQEGMILELSQTGSAVVANTSSYSALTTSKYRVIDVYFADRANGASSTIATTNGGYFVLDCYSTSAATEAAAAWNNDGYFVYRYGAVSDGLGSGYPLARGLFYFLQDGTLLTEQLETSYFGLARSGYKSLRARIVQGASAGTPEDWDLSDITGEMLRVKKGSGKGRVNTVLCNSALAMAIGRRNKSENSVQVFVGNTGAANGQSVAMPEIPQTMTGPDGKPVKVIVDECIPNNSLMMLDSKDLWMHQLGSFDFLRLYGDIWGPTKGDNYTNYEALYGGYLQFSADRCDNMVLMQDLRDDI